MTKWQMGYLKARFRHKRQRTPEGFQVEEDKLAFWINYDQDSQDIQLSTPKAALGGSIDPDETTPTDEPISFGNVMNASVQYDLTKGTIFGWYLSDRGKAQFQWGTFIKGMWEDTQKELNKKSKKRKREQSGDCAEINTLWTLRGFFIGNNTNHALPSITVLCTDTQVSRRIVKSAERQVAVYQLDGWSVARLPYVHVLAFGPPSSSPDSDGQEGPGSDDQKGPDSTDRERWAAAEAEAERQLEKIEVRAAQDSSFPTMTNEKLPSWEHERHKCGIRLEVTRGSDVVAKGTVGGLIKVGDKVYGLTVAHTLSPLNAAAPGQQDQPNDQDHLPAFPGAEDTSTSNDEELSAVLSRWQRSQSIGTAFDWALIEMPGLQQLSSDPDLWDDVNLVRTIGGDFRPVVIAFDQPLPLSHIVLATPGSTHCLRGVFIGSQALMNIPSSTELHTPWVLRMELPWLIRPGDSGSWAFDAHTGQLLGMLIGGCPELLEAYIIPAHWIFDDIEKSFGGPVKLLNSQPLQKKNLDDLTRAASIYRELADRTSNNSDVTNIEALDNQATEWQSKNAAEFQENAVASFKLRVAGSWRSPLSIIRYDRLLDSGPNLPETTPPRFDLAPGLDDDLNHTFGRRYLTGRSRTTFQALCQETLLQSPQQCYNFLSERLAPGIRPNSIETLHMFRNRLALGHIKVPFNQDILEDSTNRDVLKNEARLMSHVHDPPYLESMTPWDRRTLATTVRDMENGIAKMLQKQKWEHHWASLPETAEIGELSVVPPSLTKHVFDLF